MHQKGGLLISISLVFFRNLRSYILGSYSSCYIIYVPAIFSPVILSGCQTHNRVYKSFGYKGLKDITCFEKALKSSKLISNVRRADNHFSVYIFEFEISGIKTEKKTGSLRIDHPKMDILNQDTLHYYFLYTDGYGDVPKEILARAEEVYTILASNVQKECGIRAREGREYWRK